jgi:hypothetical protein
MVFPRKLTNAKLEMKLPAFIETGSLLKYVYKFTMPELLMLIGLLKKFLAHRARRLISVHLRVRYFSVPWDSCIQLTSLCSICLRYISLQYHFIYTFWDFLNNIFLTHFASPVWALHVPTNVHRISLRHAVSKFMILPQIVFNRQSGFLRQRTQASIHPLNARNQE